jgi:hypothetical protein
MRRRRSLVNCTHQLLSTLVARFVEKPPGLRNHRAVFRTEFDLKLAGSFNRSERALLFLLGERSNGEAFCPVHASYFLLVLTNGCDELLDVTVPEVRPAARFLEALVDFVPVDDVPPRIQIFGATILILQVVGVLPHVVAEDRHVTVANGIVLIGRRLDV